ncbi:Maintenance of mitochondrial morphology protein 1 [Erysiphe neolycopersici]|uniref:Maintenance of mitochondrial morphology protein 1 n=1 Tax=Erysiphe neolycopersici TaxID=212602 RepID=A0A420HZW5_9PEZI|nr:Maintenance of mitochondrial morphology protein 1 [Erysiphe neolycopersici]
MPDHFLTNTETTSYSFTQGLLLGQLSIVVLIGAFIKFFIFGDPPSPETSASLNASKRSANILKNKRSLLSVRSSTLQPRAPVLNKKRSSILRNPPPLTTNTILSKTYYQVNSHQPESLDWFNVLIAQTIAQFRADAQYDDAILTSLTAALNGNSRPDYLDKIKVTELSLGEEFPIFSNCRVIPIDEDGFSLGSERERNSNAGGVKEPSRLQARMDVDLNDFITLAVETKLLLNYPKPLVAVLPVALAVTIVRFSGTLSISFVPGNPQSATLLTFSFLDDYRLDLSIRSLVGSKARLQDIPKIAQLVERRLKTWFDERVVEPVFQQIELPSLWPRKKNTR